MFPLGDGTITHLNRVLQRHRGVGRPHREVISPGKGKGPDPDRRWRDKLHSIAGQERL